MHNFVSGRMKTLQGLKQKLSQGFMFKERQERDGIVSWTECSFKYFCCKTPLNPVL